MFPSSQVGAQNSSQSKEVSDLENMDDINIYSNINNNYILTLNNKDKYDSSSENKIEEKPMDKIKIFFSNIEKILNFFENNAISINEASYESKESIMSYPKYLTSQDLFDLQLQDSSFRKTILTQFYIVLKSFLNPVSQNQKKVFAFDENQV